MAVLSVEALVLLALLTLTPGPDTFLTLRQALTGGLRQAVPTIVGITSGTPVHAALAGFGLAVVLQQSPSAFRAIQWAGVAYLAFLGLRSLRTALQRGPEAQPGPELAAGGLRGWAALRDGLATNLLNPKVALFYLGFLPQFIPPGPAFAATAILYGVLHSIMGQVQLTTVAVLADQVRGKLTGPAFRRGTEGVAGIALLLFAVRLAFA